MLSIASEVILRTPDQLIEVSNLMILEPALDIIRQHFYTSITP